MLQYHHAISYVGELRKLHWQDCFGCHPAAAGYSAGDYAAAPGDARCNSSSTSTSTTSTTSTTSSSSSRSSSWPAAEGTAMVDENAWWYQGPRTCRKCGQKAYLRQGVCYNMECVTCLINWSGLFLGLLGSDSFMMSFCFFNGLRH